MLVRKFETANIMKIPSCIRFTSVIFPNVLAEKASQQHPMDGQHLQLLASSKVVSLAIFWLATPPLLPSGDDTVALASNETGVLPTEKVMAAEDGLCTKVPLLPCKMRACVRN